MRSAAFDKKAARQAANYAIDKQAMIQKMMAGLGRQVATVVQPAAFGFDSSVPPYPYDPKKAKELLAQAGYPNGVDIMLHSSSVDWRPHFEALGQMLTEVGLRTTVKMWDPARPGISSSSPRARRRTDNTAIGVIARSSTL